MTDETNERSFRELFKQSLVTISELNKQLAESGPDPQEPIAIVGMGCRYPGGVTSPESYWKLLTEGRDGISRLAPARWAAPTAGSVQPELVWAGLLDDIEGFDADVFDISPREATTLDPQQRLLLEVTWEAFEEAGIPPDSLNDSATGVFVGLCSGDYRERVFSIPRHQMDAYGFTGTLDSIASGRVSYAFGLQGPSITIDTACSSSLVAVDLACKSLRTGTCNLALAGGVNLILSRRSMEMLSHTQALSPDGRCWTFDSRANGFVRSEGCGIVVLKRLSDASRDGDRIRALILGSAVNQDGRSTGLTAPNVISQQKLALQALSEARIKPHEVGYIEAHGSGTPLGDPIEMEALKTVFGTCTESSQTCYVGSVKTNFGHLEAAAGIAGLMKVVLSLEHNAIPPHLNFRTLNPRISIKNTRLSIPLEMKAWEAETGKRYSGVSSFGLSGTNAHVVLGEAPELPQSRTDGARSSHILTVSARTPEALQARAGNLAEFLASHPSTALEDVSHTESSGRVHLEHRAAIVGSTTIDLQERLARLAQEGPPVGLRTKVTELGIESPRVAFLFSGQGSQYADMARKLYESQPTFRRVIDQCDDILRPVLERSLTGILYSEDGPDALSDIHQTQYTQPALFAIEYALAELWRSWGITPDIVMGHSVGEYVAACVAGVLSLEDGLALIAERGRLMQSLPGDGAMASVRADAARVSQVIDGLEDQVAIAAINGPQNVVISGARQSILKACGNLEADGIDSKRLEVSHAFHSPLMDPMLDELEARAAGIAFHNPKIPLISNVTGDVVTEGAISAGYWRVHARQPVRFEQGMLSIYEQGIRVFLEIGPDATLLALGSTCLPDKAALWLPSQKRDRDSWEVILESLGRLYEHGVKVDWKAFHAPYAPRKISLPTYPWQRQRYWLEPGPAQSDEEVSDPLGAQNGIHPLLSAAFVSSIDPTKRFWQAEIGTERFSYLADHRIEDTVVLPAAAQLELVLAALNEAYAGSHYAIEDVSFEEVIVLGTKEIKRLQLALVEEQPGELSFYLSVAENESSRHAGWSRHATGRIRVSGPSAAERVMCMENLTEIQARCQRAWDAEECYEHFNQQGLHYGPAFRGIERVLAGDHEVLAKVALPDEAGESGQYRVHPALLDACFQSLVMAGETGEHRTQIPVGLRSLRLYDPPGPQVWSHAVLRKQGDSSVLEGDVTLLNDAGQPWLEVRGLRLRDIEPLRQHEAERLAKLLFEPQWQSLELAEEAPQAATDRHGRWLLLADQGGVADRVRSALKHKGRDVLRVDTSSGFVDTTSEQALHSFLSGTFDEETPCEGIVVFFGLDAPAVDEGDVPSSQLTGAAYIKRLLALLQALTKAVWRDPPRLWLITRGAQATEADRSLPGLLQAPLWGLGRTIAYELPALRCTRVDLSPSPMADEPEAIANELLVNRNEEEVALRPEGRYVGRLCSTQLRVSSDEVTAPANGRSFRLDLDTPGVLDRLKLRPVHRRAPGPGEVEIKVEAAGLNFRDVLTALGVIPPAMDTSGHIPLGSECSGRVAVVGEGVEGLEPGMEVICLCQDAFSTHVIAPALLVLPKPSELSFIDAATMPIVHLTAYYALAHVARLSRGERVLIHAATGGVGLAAVQWARHVGAEIYATAGNQEKRDYLYNLGLKHVSDSRSDSFVDDILTWTDGEGVDVVLNSLSGGLLDKGLGLLREHGRFIELGKRDYLANRQLGLRPFLRNLTLSLVNLADMMDRRPGVVRELFKEVLSLYSRGALAPLPSQVFPISEVQSAFRTMAQTRHIGKLIVSLDASDVVVSQPSHPSISFAPDATYLLTGGLGGLGLSVARWMVEQGARRLLLVGRGGIDTPRKQEAVTQLEDAGAVVEIACADISDREQVRSVLSSIRDEHALKGVIHLAAVLDDGLLENQTLNKFEQVMAPKIRGAWYLHELTRDISLDFFILYSSTASLLGSAGQGNYAAANAFLDALAHHRRFRSLPALSINWGPYRGVGIAAAQTNRGERLRSRGMEGMKPEQGTAVLNHLLGTDFVQVAAAKLDLRHWFEFYPSAAESSLLQTLRGTLDQTEAHPSSSRLHDALLAAPESQRLNLVERFLREELALILRADVTRMQPEAPMKSFGVDSLTGLELRNRIELELALTLPATMVWAHPTVRRLAGHLLGLLFDARQGPSEEVLEGEPRGITEHLERYKALSDEALIEEVTHLLE